MADPNTSLVTAIESYTDDAKDLFDDGHATNFPPLPGEPADATAKRAQGMVAAGLQKLEQAAEMRSKQAGREGYADVVKLMKTTARTAEVTCKRIRTLLIAGVSSTEEAELKVLNATLLALAALSPAAIWATGPDDSTKS